MAEIENEEIPTKIQGMSIKIKIMIIAIVPMLVLAIALTTYGVTSMRSGMREEAMAGLEYSAHAMAAAYDAISAKDYVLQEKGGVGTLYKGGFNVTQNEQFIDKFTGDTDLEVTVFFGATRYATSLKDEAGERLIGTDADAEVVDKVIGQGQDYETYSLDINGQNFFAYYIPITNSDGTNVGMYFAGKPSAEVDATINQRLIMMIILAAIMVIIAGLASFLASNAIAKVIKNVQKIVVTAAHGDLNVHIPEKFMRRKDEVGLMSNAMQRLVDVLQSVISKILGSAVEVDQNAVEMNDMVATSVTNAHEVSNSMETISQGATSQANDTDSATQNVNDMGEAITEIVEKVENLTVTSNEINEAREEAENIINELAESSDRTIEAVDVIGKQVKLTDESVSKISEAIVMITSIAEETNLLSLNASIEAARAGEAGKGFAVVASEIQKLAEESAKSAEQISHIIDNLSKESKNTVTAMNKVQEIVEVQQQKLVETREKFDGVGDGINRSLVAIDEIGKDTREIDVARVHVTDLIQKLNSVSKENASETQLTMASMEELASTMQLIDERADDLRRLSEELDKEVHYFKLDNDSQQITEA